MLSIQVQSLRFKWPARLARAATALVLALSLLMILPHSVNLARTASDTSTGPERAMEKKVKSFRGEAVRHHIEKLSLKNKALSRAIKGYAKRGLDPKWDDSLATVQVSDEAASTSRAAGPFQLASYRPQQEDYVDGDSEITFITFSGDLNYWDGIVYVHTPYQDDTYSGNFLTPTDDGTNWDVVNEVYYPPDGGTPCDGSRECMAEQQTKASPGNKQKADGKTASLAHGNASPVRPGLWGWLKGWWGCVTSFCTLAGQVCGGVRYRFLCRVGLCVYGLWGCL